MSKLKRQHFQCIRGAMPPSQLLHVHDTMQAFQRETGDECPFKLVQIDWEKFRLEYSSTEAGRQITTLLIRHWIRETTNAE